jgi:citrate synthase (EC 2.3.3.1)
MTRNTLTITDNRTGKTYEIPIEHNTIRATDLRQIKTDPDDFGLMSYDPAFMNTAACISRITYIDGDRGILEYRGYPIEQLAEQSSYLEVAYLLLYGELPSKERLEWWEYRISRHLFLHNSLVELIQAFRYDAHPMGILISSVAACQRSTLKQRTFTILWFVRSRSGVLSVRSQRLPPSPIGTESGDRSTCPIARSVTRRTCST